jgi:hypothetical protein
MAVAGLFAFGLATLIFKGRSDNGPSFSLITLAHVMMVEQIATTAPLRTGRLNRLSGFSSLGGPDPFGGFYYLVVAASVAVTTAADGLKSIASQSGGAGGGYLPFSMS